MIPDESGFPIPSVAPRRGIYFGRGRWALGFYKIGQSWVLVVKLPKFGLLHWSHWSLRFMLATFPRAFTAYIRNGLRG